MTNEVGSGLGVRQPAGPIGGTAPFGVIKFSFKNQSFSMLAKDSSGNYGKVLQTVDIGAMTEDLAVLVWLASQKTVATASSGAGSFAVLVSIRDATVQPTVTDAQFAKSANGSSSSPITSLAPIAAAAAIGTTVSDGNLLTGASLGPSAYSAQFNVGSSTKVDSYGNVIKTGDDIVLDFGGIIFSPGTLAIGTYDITAWVTAMFS